MPPRELERRDKHKLAVLRHVEEASGDIPATCRYYGFSRQRLLQRSSPVR